MIHTIDINQWHTPLPDDHQQQSLSALEQGKVIYFPNLSFPLRVEEEFFLTPASLQGTCKNISLNTDGAVKGVAYRGRDLKRFSDMMTRFKTFAQGLIENLMPRYKDHLQLGRTSYRPVEIFGRQYSARKDDTRLHVDAFPSSPNQGKRILRVFSNLNFTEPRIWNLGEPFLQVVQRFAHCFKPPIMGSRRLLSWLNITKSYRTLYDHYMLQLHDAMKLDQDYQNSVEKMTFSFDPNTTWIVMTDHVSHAALRGQYVLEQTFYLDVQGMQTPELSPLSMLERHFGSCLMG